jgi:hypothetical protein
VPPLQVSPLLQSLSCVHCAPLAAGLPELTQVPPLQVSPVLQSLSCVHCAPPAAGLPELTQVPPLQVSPVLQSVSCAHCAPPPVPFEVVHVPLLHGPLQQPLASSQASPGWPQPAVVAPVALIGSPVGPPASLPLTDPPGASVALTSPFAPFGLSSDAPGGHEGQVAFADAFAISSSVGMSPAFVPPSLSAATEDAISEGAPVPPSSPEAAALALLAWSPGKQADCTQVPEQQAGLDEPPPVDPPHGPPAFTQTSGQAALSEVFVGQFPPSPSNPSWHAALS